MGEPTLLKHITPTAFKTYRYVLIGINMINKKVDIINSFLIANITLFTILLAFYHSTSNIMYSFG